MRFSDPHFPGSLNGGRFSDEDGENGIFGWFIDPEGNKVEFWEPPERPPAT